MLTDTAAGTAPPAATAPRKRAGALRTAWDKPWLRLAALGVFVLSLVAIHLFTDVPGSLAFAVQIRGLSVLAMLVVAAAVGASTVVFHTITQNRILTPSIMGFDSFYMLISTIVVSSSVRSPSPWPTRH